MQSPGRKEVENNTTGKEESVSTFHYKMSTKCKR
jgi:hypothetical protein